MSGPIAQLSAVTKRFGSVQALDNLTLAIGRAKLLRVSDRTERETIAIALLLGLQRPDAGSACRLERRRVRRRRVGVMMQEVGLAPEMKVREHIELVASYYPAAMSPDQAMGLTHVDSLAQRPYGKLSGGQKRLVQFAIAVCGRPELLFLDEPTVGLDVEARGLLWATVRQLRSSGTAIVLTTHYLEEAEALADRVAVLARGRLVASGTVSEIRSVVDRKRIICSTELAPDDIRSWPGVDSVTHGEGRLHLTVRNAEAIVRRLLAADSEVRDLEVMRAGLAEAFTELTQERAG